MRGTVTLCSAKPVPAPDKTALPVASESVWIRAEQPTDSSQDVKVG